MKRFRAVVLYTDNTFEARGFDDPDDARRWCEAANRRNPSKVVFWAFVSHAIRGDIQYELEPT